MLKFVFVLTCVPIDVAKSFIPLAVLSEALLYATLPPSANLAIGMCNFAKLPLFTAFKNPVPYFLTALAFTTNSPLLNIAGMLSLVDVPSPLTFPPVENFLISPPSLCPCALLP